MDDRNALIERPASPEYVLEVFRALHRQESVDGMGDTFSELNFDTSIFDWFCAMGCDECLELPQMWARVIAIAKSLFAAKITLDDLRAISCPSSTGVVLRDVCQLIARSGRRPSFQPITLFGSTSRSAGAFLAIRSMLRDAGVPAEEIAPSTPLAKIARRDLRHLCQPIMLLDPERFSPLQIRENRLVKEGGTLCLTGLVALLAALCWTGLFPTAFWYLFMGFVLILIGRQFSPKAVEIGEARTFRDLARAIAEEPATI